jgi:hypothetical protein
MVFRWFLFETRTGELLLYFLERRVGLSVVRANWLGAQRSCEMVTTSEVRYEESPEACAGPGVVGCLAYHGNGHPAHRISITSRRIAQDGGKGDGGTSSA